MRRSSLRAAEHPQCALLYCEGRGYALDEDNWGTRCTATGKPQAQTEQMHRWAVNRIVRFVVVKRVGGRFFETIAEQ